MSLNCLTISDLRKLMYVFIFMQKKKEEKKREKCDQIFFSFRNQDQPNNKLYSQT